MKILLNYLKPYKWLIALALVLAAINQTFSMLDPYLFGKLMDKFGTHPFETGDFDPHTKVFHKTGTRTQSEFIWGLMGFLGMLIGVAMVSRIAKAFQDYFGNVIVQKFGAAPQNPSGTSSLSKALALRSRRSTGSTRIPLRSWDWN